MSEGSVNPEEGNQANSKWARLKGLFRKSPVVNKQEVSPNLPSGYMQFIDGVKTDIRLGGVDAANLLTGMYADLISVITSDDRLTEQTKQLFLDKINAGDADTIAVAIGRLYKATARKTINSQGVPAITKQIPGISFLAGRIQKYFIENQVTNDSSSKPTGIKEHEARQQYFDAVEHPSWQPGQLAPVSPVPEIDLNKEFAGINLDPDISNSPQK